MQFECSAGGEPCIAYNFETSAEVHVTSIAFTHALCISTSVN
jgi:hypothetical protein